MLITLKHTITYSVASVRTDLSLPEWDGSGRHKEKLPKWSELSLAPIGTTDILRSEFI